MQEDKWLRFIDKSNPKQKTKMFTVWSKCSECILGEIKWHPHWRNYCYLVDELDSIYSDRCLLSISQFITKLNVEHKGGNGLPPTSKDVGIRPTIL